MNGKRDRWWSAACAAATAFLAATVAVPRAEGAEPSTADGASEADKTAATRATGASRGPWPAEQRPFAFVLDPTTPAAGDASLEYRLGYASGTAAERPLPSTVAAGGVEQALTLGYGLTSRIATAVSIRILQPPVGGASARATASAGARFQLTDPRAARLRVTVATVVFREMDGAFGAYARVAASYDVARLRVAANLHVERVLAGGRDAADILAMAGASYQTLESLRVGLEYVGQDLEGVVDGYEAEGGARHYVGPDLALSLLRDRLKLVVAGVVGVGTRAASPLLGRFAALMTF